MVPKILWVVLPLALYAAYAAATAFRRRIPIRQVFNAQTSLLLMLYLLVTAGLGVFWVARQQLPVFDLHYLFGYASLALVAVHLTLNLPLAWRHVTRTTRPTPRAGPRAAAARRSLTTWLTIAAALAGAFVLGTRHGGANLTLTWSTPGAAGAQALGPVSAIVQYHEYSSQSRSELFARAPSVDWGPEPPEYKPYPEAERVSLPALRPVAGGGRSLSEALAGPAFVTGDPSIGHQMGRQTISSAALSTLLYHAAGTIRLGDGTIERPAPSSGALFPTEIYVAARRVNGLAAGLYHFDPEHHRLDRLTTRVPTAAELGVPHEAAALERAPAALVLTARFQRTGFKYEDRAYRYATLDVGHLMANLQVAAAETGSVPRFVDRFDEEVSAKTLGVDGIEEGVMALAVIEPGPWASPTTLPMGFRYPEPPAKPDKAIGVTGMVHLATSLRTPCTPSCAPQASASAAGGDGGAPAAPTLLPAPRPAPAPALQTIIERRSKRRFTDEPITRVDLGSVLADAIRPPVLSPAVLTYVVVNRVTELPPGIYRYLPARHGLEPVALGDVAKDAYSAGLSQDVVGDAAVVFILAAGREAVLTGEGARGYRHVLLEAGVIGERIMLSVTARGLGGCPVGAFYDDEAARLIGAQGRQQWVLHFAAIGRVAP
ncbi:MAG: SagB/ThcOx family dehydrogenase [Deltaproteobacteria bacterium]|nr:SagB/ThcOx family dehydrogenase [Deltaproteobacteria bacterium]